MLLQSFSIYLNCKLGLDRKTMVKFGDSHNRKPKSEKQQKMHYNFAFCSKLPLGHYVIDIFVVCQGTEDGVAPTPSPLQ